MTKKKIPRGNRSVEVHQEDLMDADEIAEARDRPLNTSVAAITLSTLQKLSHQLFNKHEHLYVVSKSIRPSKGASRLNTANNTPESSKDVSPTTTFPANMR